MAEAMLESNASDPALARWRRFFAEILMSDDPSEVERAAVAAAQASERGADENAAKATGKAAAKEYRARRVPGRGEQDVEARVTPPEDSSSWLRATAQRTAAQDSWQLLAPRLIALPARWGWRAVAEEPLVVPTVTQRPPRPVLTEPPPPDTTSLREARSRAISRLVRRTALTVIAAFAFLTYQVVIAENVATFGDSAQQVYVVVVVVLALWCALALIRAAAAVGHASRNITRFEQPYQALRAAERERYRQALEDWEQAVRAHEAEAAEGARLAAARANGPLWYPVRPASEPTRLDVLGGDPRRHGWASLLTTLGTSALSAGQRVTVLDFTGQDVGGGLLRVAEAAGIRCRDVQLAGDEFDLDLLVGITQGPDPAKALSYALSGREERGELREERALVVEVLRRVLGCLSGEPTFARLAAGVRVLRQGVPDPVLSSAEVSCLTGHVGDVGRSEWVDRRLRFLTSQLEILRDAAPGTGPPFPFWTTDPVSVIATPGRRDDRKELIDRVVVQLAHAAMDEARLEGFLIVAGADHLGVETLRLLSDHARQAGVRLGLMIDHPQGGIERSAGTGGVVCIMKMYNHHDANVAAEFIGRGHKFVVNQITRQVGKTFTDTGGDSFAAGTTQSSSAKQKSSGRAGRGTAVSESRAHTWTGTRSWSAADNLSTSTGSGRVYEFIVEPQEIMGMPETAFILVDNSGIGRGVTMADANPGICLLERVATTVG